MLLRVRRLIPVMKLLPNAVWYQTLDNGNAIYHILLWIGVIVTLAFLLIERAEKKRPYLEISFELVRSILACVVIRNVGEVPAELKSMNFNNEFIKQLDKSKIQSL